MKLVAFEADSKATLCGIPGVTLGYIIYSFENVPRKQVENADDNAEQEVKT